MNMNMKVPAPHILPVWPILPLSLILIPRDHLTAIAMVTAKAIRDRDKPLTVEGQG